MAPVAKWRRSCRETELRPAEEVMKVEGQICFQLTESQAGLTQRSFNSVQMVKKQAGNKHSLIRAREDSWLSSPDGRNFTGTLPLTWPSRVRSPRERFDREAARPKATVRKKAARRKEGKMEGADGESGYLHTPAGSVSRS